MTKTQEPGLRTQHGQPCADMEVDAKPRRHWARPAAGALLVAALISVGHVCLFGLPPKPVKPKIVIGHDTTRISGPLRQDGTVDYVVATNQKYGKGVTPENNAFVMLFQAVGPELLPAANREKMLSLLDAGLPEDDLYFVSFKGRKRSFSAALDAPWRARDYPELAAWLRRNSAPLGKFISASQRKRYYCPATTEESGQGIFGVLLPRLDKIRAGAKALTIRANLAIGEERLEDAWRDIMAIHRLGILMNHSATVIERLVAMAIGSTACDATIRLAASGGLSPDMGRKVLQALAALGPTPSVVDAIDEAERYVVLGSIIWISRHPEQWSMMLGGITTSGKGDQKARKDRKDSKHAKALISLLKSENLDWSDILRRVNEHCDERTRTMQLPTFAERAKAGKEFGRDFRHWRTRRGGEMVRKFQELAIDASKARVDKGSPSEETRWAGDWLMIILLPALSRGQILADISSVRRDTCVLAVALATYRAEKGQYPARLPALAPDYIKTVPSDLCSGKPFVYRLRGNGFLLYSVGENMIDDGGRDRKADGDDIVVQVPPK